MSNLSATTLMVAIQAVDVAVTELTELKAEIGKDSPEAKDVEELLLSYTHAARELEAAYRDEQSTSSFLPTYESLGNQA